MLSIGVWIYLPTRDFKEKICINAGEYLLVVSRYLLVTVGIKITYIGT